MITQENIPYTADEIKAMVKTCEKYNKALERASKLKVQNPFDTVEQMVEHIFSELKENEDERIRKGLIKAVSRIFEGNKLFDTDVTREEALAWLEKQGENKKLDTNKVIEWLNDQACLGWIEDVEVDKFVEKFKKDFGL